MNKAFVRETDAPPPTCSCGFTGVPVTPETVERAVGSSAAGAASAEMFYCPRAPCSVAYFDGWGASIPAEALQVRAYPKDPEAPVCACLSIRAAEIVEEAGRGERGSILRILEHLKTGPDCAAARPDGRTCEREARRLFLEHRPQD